MPIRGVIGDEIEDDLQSELVDLGDKVIEVLKRPEQGIDAGIVRDIVAEVRHRRDEDGRNPDRIDTEFREIGKALHDAAQIADTVAVAVLKRTRIDLVDDPGLPPRRLHGHAPSLMMTPSSARNSSAPDTCAPF